MSAEHQREIERLASRVHALGIQSVTIGRAHVTLGRHDFEGLLALAESVTPLSDLDAKKLGPFARDSETSRKAALANYPRQGTQRHRIIEALRHPDPHGRHGLTREQIAQRTGITPDAVRPRVVELIEGGWLWAHETRKTRLGQDAEILLLTRRAVET